MKQSNFTLYSLLISALICSYISADASTCGSATACNTSCSTSKSTWIPRPFVSYQEHDLLDTQDVFRKDEFEKGPAIHTSFFTEFMQSFGGKCGDSCKNLGAMPFWSGTNTLTIGNHDGRADLDAYQLGLGNVITDSDGIAGIIQLNPKIQHFGTDMLLHYIHKHNERGFYFKIHAPVGAMKITPNLTTILQAEPNNELGFTQETSNPSSSNINYQFLEYPTPERRQKSVAEAFYGGLFDGEKLVGNVAKPTRLRFARIAPDSQTIIRIGDITASVGYNVVSTENGFFGVAFKTSCPTGNVPSADYALEPIFGRAGLWGVGGEISGIYNIWDNHDASKRLTVSVQGEILHLLTGRRPNFRTFDLKKNGPGSKYMLVQSYINLYESDQQNGTPAGTAIEFPGELKQVANITTLPVLSKFSVEGSFAAALNYNHDNWNISLGGEVWGRTKEHLAIDFVSAVDLRLQNLNDYAVLGRQVSGYQIDGQGLLFTYYCEPSATISKSQNPVTLIGSVTTVTAPTTLPDGIADARIASNRIPADLCEALDIASAQAASAVTGKIFGEVGYTWTQHCHQPSLAFVGGAEFTGANNNTVQLWSVGLQGSLQF